MYHLDFICDAEGKTSTKTTYSNNNPVDITTYHYYNGELLYETLSTDPANVIHALYIRTPAGALEAVSLNYVVDSSSNTFYYYHYNAHGDVIAVTKTDSSDPTNITGKIYRQYTYDPYGNIISAKDGSGNAIDINNDSGFDDSYLYAGYRYDKESGLYFLKARYYAPELGRFLAKDSEIDLNNTKTLNSYEYVEGDPTNKIDPSGNSSSDVLFGVIIVGVAIVGIAALSIATCGAGDAVLVAGMGTLTETLAQGAVDLTACNIAAHSIASSIAYEAEHVKGARQSTKAKHQEGQARKKKDKGGEKGDKRRIYRGNKKRIITTVKYKQYEM